jgi:prepilin-type N-terminal cleavage/methylation domain-containing protein
MANFSRKAFTIIEIIVVITIIGILSSIFIDESFYSMNHQAQLDATIRKVGNSLSEAKWDMLSGKAYYHNNKYVPITRQIVWVNANANPKSMNHFISTGSTDLRIKNQNLIFASGASISQIVQYDVNWTKAWIKWFALIFEKNTIKCVGWCSNTGATQVWLELSYKWRTSALLFDRRTGTVNYTWSLQ